MISQKINMLEAESLHITSWWKVVAYPKTLFQANCILLVSV